MNSNVIMGQDNRNKSGVVLLVVVSMLGALFMLSGALILIFKVDLRAVGSYRDGVTAFHNADSGVAYVFRRIRADLDAGTLTLDDPNETVNYTAPSGISFNAVTNLTRLPNGRSYMYRVTGRVSVARATIEVVVDPPGTAFVSIPGAVVQISNGWNDHDVDGLVSGFDESGSCPDQAGHFSRGTSVNIQGSTVEGDPIDREYDGSIDDPIWDDPVAVVDMVEGWMTDPSAVTITGDTPPATLGTAAAPQITVWDPSSTSTDSGASFTGYGILIIVGRCNLVSGFEFHGLIVAYGGDEMAIEGGNSQILHGAILAANDDPSPGGEATEIGILDGAEVRYNCDSLNDYAGLASGGESLVVLSWKHR